MRRLFATILIAPLFSTTTACGSGPSGDPAPAAASSSSAAPASAADRKNELCGLYWQTRDEVASVFMASMDTLLDPAAASPAKVEEVKQKIGAAYEKQRSALDAALSRPADAELVALLRDLTANIQKTLTKLAAAGSDGARVMDVLSGEEQDTVERKVFEACGGRAQPSPSPQAGS